jgi:hypothetical protein
VLIWSRALLDVQGKKGRRVMMDKTNWVASYIPVGTSAGSPNSIYVNDETLISLEQMPN